MSNIIPLLLVSIVLSACAGASGNEPLSESSETPMRTPLPEPQNSPESPPETTACSSPEIWMIQYHRSGGFAGFDQMLTVNSDGELMIKSERPPADMGMAIPPDDVARITSLLVDACPFEQDLGKDTCADCFMHELEITMDGQSYFVRATDFTLTAELQALISVLSEYLQTTDPKSTVS